MSDKIINPKRASGLEKKHSQGPRQTDRQIHELNNKNIVERQNQKYQQRTADLFDRMIDLRKAQKIIMSQKRELELKRNEINRQQNAIDRTFNKFRERTIVFFNKTIDLKKAYQIIDIQKDEIEKQKKAIEQIKIDYDKLSALLAQQQSPINGIVDLSGVLANQTEWIVSADSSKYNLLRQNSSKELGIFLDNIMLWSDWLQNRVDIKPKIIDLSTFLEQIIDDLKTNSYIKNIQVSCAINPGTLIMVDHRTLSFALRNITSKIINTHNANSAIQIKTLQEQNIVSLTIYSQDNLLKKGEIYQYLLSGKNLSESINISTTIHDIELIISIEFLQLNGGKISFSNVDDLSSNIVISLPLHN